MPMLLSKTTLSPIVIFPLVGVSRPAIILSVVVLPQPGGPKRIREGGGSFSNRFRIT